jgi:uncharacterized tellurite resistance protein B-like protein
MPPFPAEEIEMLDKLKRFLERDEDSGRDFDFDSDPAARRQVAAAALLAEAAQLDAKFDKKERAAIEQALQKRFALSDRDVKALMRAAEEERAERYDDSVFTETVRQSYSAQERRDMVDMLWDVAYADGRVHKFEAHLVGRIAAAIGIDSTVTEELRQAAMARAGASD